MPRRKALNGGERGPENAGCYDSIQSGVPFLEEGQESFLSDYGHFFLVHMLYLFNIIMPDLCMLYSTTFVHSLSVYMIH